MVTTGMAVCRGVHTYDLHWLPTLLLLSWHETCVTQHVNWSQRHVPTTAKAPAVSCASAAVSGHGPAY